MKKISIFILSLLWVSFLPAQQYSLVNTSQSPYARMKSVNITDVHWTTGFWAERFAVCRDSSVTSMWKLFDNPDIAHSFRNFEIAAGLEKGEHVGPPFHDGDFYKWFEGLAMVYAQTHNAKTDSLMDAIIAVIAKAQRADGYIHTPVIIEELNSGKKTEFSDRLNFETYNHGHLMTAACIHYRITGKRNLLDVAIKATDYLYNFYKRSSPELARNAICPSHYMGVVEMYRTTRDPKYLELAKNLIDIRGMVDNGTDDNQDRVPFRQQTKAMGHAVRANYLYAGVADVYAETGDTSLLRCLNLIWDDMVQRKMYITGACGALYDGTSPDGTSYQPTEIQKVHQSYGRDYQLPNLTAHNESCANIGNVLWNWRMFLLTGNSKYADVMEKALYNSVLAGINLNGNKYFYTNPLAVSADLPYTLRWSKDRESYISFCNCCPPNTVRTIAEVSNYAYSLTDSGIYCVIYGSNTLKTKLKDGSILELEQTTEYPWDGTVTLKIKQAPKATYALNVRIPSWCQNATINVNQTVLAEKITNSGYFEIRRNWKKGDIVTLTLPMKVKMMVSNPLVEETKNQVAVMRGPVVYCLESPDLPEGVKMSEVAVNAASEFTPKITEIGNSKLVSLIGKATVTNKKSWTNQLYRELDTETQPFTLKLIPYFAWDNRGKSEMEVWLPVIK